jgi:hypothetical protein
MIWTGCDSSKAIASLLENLGNGFVTAVARHVDEAARWKLFHFGVYACAQQKLHGFQMAGMHAKVYAMRVEILCSAQTRVALQQAS